MDNTGLSNFIEPYKQKTCLWDSNCRDYSNRNARRAALEELLQIYKQYDNTANIASVRKKIDTLRTNYNRELKKVRASETTGISPDEVYQPSLWYYQQLDFLSETHDVARGGRGSAGETEEGITEESTETAKGDVSRLLLFIFTYPRGGSCENVRKCKKILTFFGLNKFYTSHPSTSIYHYIYS